MARVQRTTVIKKSVVPILRPSHLSRCALLGCYGAEDDGDKKVCCPHLSPIIANLILSSSWCSGEWLFVVMTDQFKTKFNNAVIAEEEKKGSSSSHLSDEKYQTILSRLEQLNQGAKKSAKDYRLVKHYQQKTDLCQGILVVQLRHPITGLLYLSQSQIFDAIREEHLVTGHGARDIMHQKTKLKYANITKDQLQLFADLCEECQLKKKKVRKSLVVKPIVSRHFNHRCQCDLIDMQSEPDGDYRFILNYQDHLTKFVCLRALKRKTAEEVADQLIKIFCFNKDWEGLINEEVYFKRMHC